MTSQRQIESAKSKFPDFLDECKGIVSTACKRANISRNTYYRWLEEDPEFAAICATVQENTYDSVESKLLDAINDGNVTAIIFYCKTKLKHRGYIERVEQINKSASDMQMTLTEQDEQILERALQRRFKNGA